MFNETEIQGLMGSAKLGAGWLADIAQKKDDSLSGETNQNKLVHTHWQGSIRGEYSVANHQWGYFCPIWHTGQAIKALCEFYLHDPNPKWLDAAKSGAKFLINNCDPDPKSPEYGLLYAFEDVGNVVNASAVLEASIGLYLLTEVSGDETYRQWGARFVSWIWEHQYCKGEGLFHDCYQPGKGLIDPEKKRPLNDDAMLLVTGDFTGNAAMKTSFYEISDLLLESEDPPGNWIGFGPANAIRGSIHPRHCYWWGRPMIDAYLYSGNEKYLQCAIRSGEWYLKAIRKDGGLFRDTYTDFNTDSFGHATSGAACAVLLWNDLYKATEDQRWVAPIKKSLQYCQKMQFTIPEDPNLYGCILEKILPPNGSDRSPYQIRDLGTIFFLQAVAEVLTLTQK